MLAMDAVIEQTTPVAHPVFIDDDKEIAKNRNKRRTNTNKKPRVEAVVNRSRQSATCLPKKTTEESLALPDEADDDDNDEDDEAPSNESTPRTSPIAAATAAAATATVASSFSSTSLPAARKSILKVKYNDSALNDDVRFVKKKTKKRKKIIQQRHHHAKKRTSVLRFLTRFLLAMVVMLLVLYWLHPGVRRSIQFWNAMVPVVVEYKYVVVKAEYVDGYAVDSPEMLQVLHDYHSKTAPEILRIILYFGGIFVKIGQIISTVGTGFVPDAYIDALRPLQDGVPAKPYEQVQSIIETSTGQSMLDLFESFEPKPVGAASIAQAHRAVLKNTTDQVVVKIQYPEVADLFALDFTNVRAVARLVNPENLELLDSLRQRYDNELDFRSEAEHLREIKRNMQAHNNIEPRRVVIPAVLNATGICSRNILVLEYLPGISMKSAIQQEQQRMATAVGKTVDELRQSVIARMREQHNHDDRSEHALGNPLRTPKLMQTFGPAAARVLRVYSGIKEWIGGLFRPERRRERRQQRQRQQHVNLRRALKTLVHVHGLQMLRDGVFNVRMTVTPFGCDRIERRYLLTRLLYSFSDTRN